MTKLANRTVIRFLDGPVSAGKGRVPEDGEVIPLPPGWGMKVRVQRGRVVGATAVSSKGRRARSFVMKMAAADGGARAPATCYFCREDEEARASYGHPIPCDWILGKR